LTPNKNWIPWAFTSDPKLNNKTQIKPKYDPMELVQPIPKKPEKYKNGPTIKLNKSKRNLTRTI
jgi:hypothetical protein